jgi:predicted heme/steroid binding protein
MTKRWFAHSCRLCSMSLILFMALTLSFLIACSVTPATSAAGAAIARQETTTVAGEKTFTLDELAAFDGQDGHKAYIAVDGVIYDVTAVSQWGSKLHAGRFKAGQDYSEAIKSAPHGVDKLLTAVKIGVLTK